MNDREAYQQTANALISDLEAMLAQVKAEAAHNTEPTPADVWQLSQVRCRIAEADQELN